MHTNRISKFWHRPPGVSGELQRMYEAADGDAIYRDTGGLVLAFADPDGESAVEFLWGSEKQLPDCPKGASVRKHLARQFRKLAYRYLSVAERLEGGRRA